LYQNRRIGIFRLDVKAMENKITIKAAFADAIKLLQHRRKELKNLDGKERTIELDVNSIPKQELIDILNSVETYYFKNDSIVYSRMLNEEESKRQREDIQNGINYDIHRIENWCNSSPENKEQIESYLLRYDIDKLEFLAKIK